MNELKINELNEFFIFFYKKLISEGLVKPLEIFFSNRNDRIGRAIKSLYLALEKGKSVEVSIRSMKPCFPKSIQELLINGDRKGVLDHVVSDISKILDSSKDEESLLNIISQLVNKYQDKEENGFLCSACFKRDMNKVLARAKIEGANRVILSHEDENFFVQKYVGVKLVQIKEASNPLTYDTFKYFLKNGSIESSHHGFLLNKIDDNTFVVKNEGQEIEISIP